MRELNNNALNIIPNNNSLIIDKEKKLSNIKVNESSKTNQIIKEIEYNQKNNAYLFKYKWIIVKIRN